MSVHSRMQNYGVFPLENGVENGELVFIALSIFLLRSYPTLFVLYCKVRQRVNLAWGHPEIKHLPHFLCRKTLPSPSFDLLFLM